MTAHDIAATWTWTGSRDLPTWLDRHHHWHHDRPVIHTTDGPRTLYRDWIVIGWSDGAITVASATVAERVYGPDGIAGRLERAEAALARIQAIADEYPAGIDTALIHAALDQPAPLTPAVEARLAQTGIDTPGCDCGHTGMGVTWHRDHCTWRRSVVDCPGRPTPG
ncbi:hypothetical protein [Streptomyces bottropensis]|uniref:hypothetical protein n=1 Tax=Streptomyces bottropensis TaxID=42235 RepID=UPI0036AA1871